MKNCIICSKEFDSKRADKKTCSPACKKSLQRLKGTEPELKGTDKELKGTTILEPIKEPTKPIKKGFNTEPCTKHKYSMKGTCGCK
ncbi:MAG: hypothetical protein WCQ47_07505 [bacterium]